MEFEHVTPAQQLEVAEQVVAGLEEDWLRLDGDYRRNGLDEAKARADEVAARLETERAHRDELKAQT